MLLTWASQQNPYLPEAAAYFARMTTQPDAARKVLINTLIAGLIADGLWADLDCLYLFAAHDAQAARLNLIQSAYTCTPNNSPAFLTDRGYTCDGSSSYLDSGFGPSVAAGKFQQNDCHLGVWVGTDLSSATAIDLGSANIRILTRNGGSVVFRSNSTTSATAGLTVPTAIGHTAWTRTTAAASECFKSGVSLALSASASTAASMALPFFIGAINVGGSFSSGSARRQQAAHWGRALSAAKHTAINARLATYMAAIGA